MRMSLGVSTVKRAFPHTTSAAGSALGLYSFDAEAITLISKVARIEIDFFIIYFI